MTWVAEPAERVVRHRERVLADRGELGHPGTAGEPAEEVGRPVVARLVPLPLDDGNLLEPDGRGLLVEVEHRQRAGHRQPVGEPVTEVGAVGERLGPPRHRRLGELLHLVRDEGEHRRARPRLHDLDEQLVRRRLAVHEGVAADDVATGGRDRGQVVGELLDRRALDRDRGRVGAQQRPRPSRSAWCRRRRPGRGGCVRAWGAPKMRKQLYYLLKVDAPGERVKHLSTGAARPCRAARPARAPAGSRRPARARRPRGRP